MLTTLRPEHCHQTAEQETAWEAIAARETGRPAHPQRTGLPTAPPRPAYPVGHLRRPGAEDAG